jgi:hypothetical protein
MRASRVFQLLVSSSTLACVLTACGSGGSSETGGNNASGANGTAANGPDLGSVGASSSGGSSGSGDPGDTCAGELVEAKSIPLDMYIMLDKSGSMLDFTEGNPAQSKWQAVSAALIDFVSDPASAGLGVGLQLFPLRHPDAPASCTSNAQCGAFGPCFLGTCEDYIGILPCGSDVECEDYGDGGCVPVGECELPDQDGYTYVCTPIGSSCQDLGGCLPRASMECLQPDDCRADTYATPASAIAELPGAEAAVVTAINATEPEGATPTGPALQGALQQASDWAAAHPDHKVVAVLATDGLPTLYEQAGACTGITNQTYVSEVDAIVALAAGARAAAPSIATFTIGVMGPTDVDGPIILNMIAQAGGTQEAFIVDTQGDVAAQFRDALNQIRGTKLSCELAVPEAEAGKKVDLDKVNVTFDSGSGTTRLYNVIERSGCEADTGGWYYDTLPADGTPTRIVVCPTTCAQFGAADMGSVQIEVGCATKTPVK